MGERGKTNRCEEGEECEGGEGSREAASRQRAGVERKHWKRALAGTRWFTFLLTCRGRGVSMSAAFDSDYAADWSRRRGAMHETKRGMAAMICPRRVS